MLFYNFHILKIFRIRQGVLHINPTAYLKSDLSPYTLNCDAQKLIKKLHKKIKPEIEEKVVILLNAAELHPKMSTYQLSLTRKEFGDCYYDCKFYGGALSQYQLGLALNPRLPVKRRIKEILSLPKELQRVSLSPDMVGDILNFPEYARYAFPSTSTPCNPTKAHSLYDDAIAELTLEAQQEDRVFDPALEEEIAQRLAALGEPYQSEFYQLRDVERLTERPDILSSRYSDLFRLKSMEKSARWHTDHPKKE